MSRVFVLALLAFIHIIALPVHAQESPEQLYQSGLYKEEIKGDLESAIKIYESLIKNYPQNRSTAAKALFQVGLCNEKLGKKEARKAYQRLIDEYADQHEVAAMARIRLAALEEAMGLTKPKGVVVRQVWSGMEVGAAQQTEVSVALSSDGRFLSYVDWETGDLAVRETKTGIDRHLTHKGTWYESDEFALSSVWSPDGKMIAYNWYNKDGNFELRLLGLNDAHPQVLSTGEVIPEDWSPDGRYILAILIKKGNNHIALVSAENGSVQKVKSLGRLIPQNIGFSPDGRYIAYDFPQREDSPNHDIFLFSTKSGREIRLVEHPAHDYLLGWVPDGNRVLFASDRTGTLGAWVIQVADGKVSGVPQLVKPDIGPVNPIGFAKNGSFYYSLLPGRSDVYIAELDPKTGEVISQPEKIINRFEGTNRAADYSPDGKYLVYFSSRGPLTRNRNRRNVMCIRSLETGEERELFTKFKEVWAPEWSPDSRSVLIIGLDDKDREGIYMIDAQTGEVRTVVFGRINAHQWSPDGKAIYYVRIDKTNDLCQILVRDLESGVEKELYRAPRSESSRIALSPDGQWLSFLSKPHPRSLKIMPAAGGKPHEIHRWEQRKVALGHTWTTDGRYILFSRLRLPQVDFKWDLWRIPVKGGAPQKLELAMVRLGHLSVHPDGQHIVFASHGSTVKSGEVWVMENFLPKEKDKR